MSHSQQNAGSGGGRTYYDDPYQNYSQPYQGYNEPHQGYDQPNHSYNQPHQGYNQSNQSYDRGTYYDQDLSQHPDQGQYYDQHGYSNDPLPPIPHGSEKIEVPGGSHSNQGYDSYGLPPSQQYSDSTASHPAYDNDSRYGEHERTAPDDSQYIASKNNAPFRARTGVYSGSPTLSEAKLLVGSESLQKPRKSYSCWDYTLCRCWPRWARWICCTCLLIILGLLIAVAVIAATFKMPKIALNGVTKQENVPEYVTNGTSFSFNFALKIGVVNDNIIGATFQKIKAVAYYPIDQTPVGGGELSNVNFPSHATTNLTFPFSINYDPTLDKDQAILNDIASRCGLQGGPETKRPIVVTYAVTLYLRIIFVTITPPAIRQNTSIDCPIENGQLPQGLTPTGIPGIPTPAAT